MSDAPATAKLLLFPRCDARGEISRVLNVGASRPATRADALLMAWWLDLPARMHPVLAARALLNVYGVRFRHRSPDERQAWLLRELEIVASGPTRTVHMRKRRRKRRSVGAGAQSPRSRLPLWYFSRQPESH